MKKRRKKKKKLTEMEKLERTNKFLQIQFLVIFFLLFAIMIFFFWVFYKVSQQAGYISNYEDLDIITIEYINMTPNQIEDFQKIFADVDPIYLSKNRNFVITTGIVDNSPSCGGINIGDGEQIIIKYTPYFRTMRKTLCHELMHSYLYDDGGDRKENPIHEIVYNLGNKEVCYQTSFQFWQG